MFRKKQNRILSVMVFIVMLCSLLLPTAALASSSWDGSSYDTVWSGTGTSVDPYIIGTAAELNGLARNVNDGTSSYSGNYFKLTDDINLANYAWAPIGGACTITNGVPTGRYFAGVFDGDNHAISGINISNPNPSYGAYGLFGYVNGGTLANLTVAGSLNMGTNPISEIGAVVGYTNGNLYNLHSSMSVYVNNASPSQAGGIAGVVENTSSSTTLHVQYCSNTGAITGRGRVGGIVGAVYCVSNGGVVVDQSYNTGSLTTVGTTQKSYTGGIVGYCRGYITNCYNQGNLTTSGGHYLGGIVGILQGSSPTALLSNSYSTASYTGYNASYDRWLWASADFSSAVSISNSFYIPTNTAMSQPTDITWGTCTNVLGITSTELQGAAMGETGYVGNHVIDYLGPAYSSQSSSYPILGWQAIPNFKVAVL